MRCSGFDYGSWRMAAPLREFGATLAPRDRCRNKPCHHIPTACLTWQETAHGNWQTMRRKNGRPLAKEATGGGEPAQAGARLGSMMVLTASIRSAGKPLSRACSWMTASFSAR